MTDPFDIALQRATELIRANDHGGAISLLLQVGPFGQTKADYWSLLGQAYLTSKQADQAEQAFVRATRIRPEFATWFNLAESTFVLGDFLQAGPIFRQALACKPADPELQGITAFKIIISEWLAGIRTSILHPLEPELTGPGILYLDIARKALSSSTSEALALLGKPEAMEAACLPYLDTLLTARIISIQRPA